MEGLLPDILIVLVTLIFIFLIFLGVGNHLRVRHTFFRLWLVGWSFSIIHYLGQFARARWGSVWGSFVDVTFLAYLGITMVMAAESVRGRSLKKMLPYGVGSAALFTLWAYIYVFSKAPELMGYLRYGSALAIIFAIAGVSHWLQQRRHFTVGGATLAYGFFFWAFCFAAYEVFGGTAFFQTYEHYAYQFSNLPKPIAAIGMLIFLLEGERAMARRQRDLSESLIEDAPDGIFILDLSLNISRVNKSFEEITGKSAAELIGVPGAAIITPDLASTLKEPQGRAAYHQAKIAVDAGVTRDVLVASKPVYEDQQITGYMAMVKDVTERTRLELQLRQSEKMASIGLLVSGVAHELNNPLTSVIGFTELALQHPSISGTIEQRLNIVLSEARRTRNIVEKLLNVVRREKTERVGVDLNQIVKDTVALRQYDLRSKRISIVTDLDSDPLIILVEPSDIRQVLINLMQNAFDAVTERGAGGGCLSIRSYRAPGKAILVVSDDGPGISDTHKVFDPFYTTKDVGKGTGLGLSICYQIIKNYKGEISAENLSPGARFTISLPTSDIRQAEKPAAQPRKKEPEAAGRLLVVDDERMVLEFCREVLVDAGFNIETASNGSEAIEKLRRSSFDVIVTDYKMPGRIGGADLYRWVQEKRPGAESRIIFMTGDSVNPNTLNFLQTVGSTVIYKPFSPDELIAKVKGTLLGLSDQRSSTVGAGTAAD